MPPFTFDFTLKKPNIDYVPEQEQKNARTVKSTGIICPYPIPTVDEIIKMIDRSAYKVNRSQLISDVFECGAIAISNLVDLTQYDEREQHYKDIMNKYSPDERKLIVDIFSRIFALSSSVVYDNGEFDDYLGEIFMRCNQDNKKTGQFFTPYHISKLMAKMTLSDIETPPKKILTIGDPCCGGGGMAIAVLDVLKNDFKINYAMDCFIECADIDIRCVHMAYLQLSLAGVPAIIKAPRRTLKTAMGRLENTCIYIPIPPLL